MIKLDFASQALAANGTANGVLTVSGAYSFNRGARVYLSATGVATKELLVNEILTSTTLSVKEDHGYQYSNFDCSAYTLVLGATLTQPLQYPLEPFPDSAAPSTVLTDQGAPGILADAWPVLITDGLSSPAIRDGAPAGNEWGLVVRLAGGATGGTSDTFDAIFPTLGTAAGFNDGTKMQSARVFDADSGAGIEHVLGVQLRRAGAGGSVEIGTAATPIRTDPTGSTAQPITAASLPLPAGASTEATLGGVLTTAAFQARINTLGQKAMAASTPVTIASDQPAFPVTQSGVWHITNISGTVSLPTGAATQATLASVLLTQTDGSQKTQVTNYPASQTVDGTVTVNQGSAGADLWLVDGSGATQPVSGTVSAAQSGAWTVAVSSSGLPTGAATEATLAGKVADSTVTARLGTLGQKTMAGSAPVVLASDHSAISVVQSTTPWDVNVTNAAGASAVRIQDGGNSITVDASSWPLPTGAATEASLAAINTKTPALGLATMAASVPVVLASNQHSVAVEPPELTIATSGLFHEKAAKVYVILGRRSLGYTNTTDFQDVANYLNTGTALLSTVSTGVTYYIRSSSASDTNTGPGIGAQKVKIVYLNSLGTELVTEATLNGTTAVSLGSGIDYFQWMEVSAVGTNEVSVGDITIASVTGAPTVPQTVEKIAAGGNRSLSGRYKVPTGYTAYLQHWSASSIGNTQDLRIRAKVFAHDRSVSTVFHFQSMIFLPADSSRDHLTPYLNYPADTEIKLSTISGAVGAANRCDAHMALLLVAN